MTDKDFFAKQENNENHETYFLTDIFYIDRETKDMYGDMSHTFCYMDETRCNNLQDAINAIKDTAADTISDYNSWDEDNQMFVSEINEYKWNSDTNEYNRKTIYSIAFCPEGLDTAKFLYPNTDESIWPNI